MHLDDALPVTALLPESSSDAIVIFDAHAALRIAIVERHTVRNLSPHWDQSGVYILLDPKQSDGTWKAYVGKATGIKTRLSTHVRKKDHWTRAMLVLRDTTHGFNSAHAGWLEGRLYDLLNSAADAALHNEVRPSDETLPVYERLTLEATVLPIARILRLIGYDPQPVDDTAATAPGGSDQAATRRRTTEYAGFSLSDLITTGAIHEGQHLVSMRPTWPATATITAGQVVLNGERYSHLSAAGRAVRDGLATNGWDFWGIETQTGKVPLAVLRETAISAQRSSSVSA